MLSVRRGKSSLLACGTTSVTKHQNQTNEVQNYNVSTAVIHIWPGLDDLCDKHERSLPARLFIFATHTAAYVCVRVCVFSQETSFVCHCLVACSCLLSICLRVSPSSLPSCFPHIFICISLGLHL